MPRDEPDVLEIIQSVNEYLSDLSARVDGGDRYQLLCVRYLLDIVGRELTDGAAIDKLEKDRLMVFMNGAHHFRDSEIGAAYEQLAASISDGRLDDRLPEVLDLLMTHVENKVRISDPDFIQSNDPS